MGAHRGVGAMTDGLLRVTRRRPNGTAETLEVAGELDTETAALLENAVDRSLDGQRGEFHLDLTTLRFMDSAGASSILSVQNLLRRAWRPVHAPYEYWPSSPIMD